MSTRGSLAQAVWSSAAQWARMRPKAVNGKERAPKFCRTRGCGERFGHDGLCNGRTKPLKVTALRRHPNRQYAGRGTSVDVSPRRAPRVARPSGVAFASPDSARGRAQRVWLDEHPLPPWDPGTRQFHHPRHER